MDGLTTTRGAAWASDRATVNRPITPRASATVGAARRKVEAVNGLMARLLVGSGNDGHCRLPLVQEASDL
jgi:hypothetical protein